MGILIKGGTVVSAAGSKVADVLVEGEIWRATAGESVEKGARLRVTGHEAYLLRVERS